MKVQFSEQCFFGNSLRWTIDNKVQWVRITENVLVYQKRDNTIVRKTLKFISGLEITNDTL